MDVFLPIAQVFINPLEILLLSAIVGVLSGLFGVGGGFLMTPFLIFLGVPPTYAVANEANNILATSVSGSTTHYLKNTLDYKMGMMIVVGGGFLMTPFLIFLGVPPAYAVANEANNILATSVSGSTTHYLKNTLDYKMGFMIVIGGTIGTALGIYTFTYFKGIGKIDTVISLAYMYILAIIGTLMLVESLREIDRAKRNILEKKKLHVHYWIHGLPLRMRFPKSKLYESMFTPIIIGLVVGFIAAIMGIGGAFILVPAMIYIIKMPMKLVPGTSLFVTIFVTGFVTISHAFTYRTIDLVLVLILIAGSIAGVHTGQKVGQRLQGSQLKALLAILMLSVGLLMAYETFFKNKDNVSASLKLPTNKIAEISDFGNSIYNLSNSYPIVYGLSSIFIALFAGVLISYIRRQISKRMNAPKTIPPKAI